MGLGLINMLAAPAWLHHEAAASGAAESERLADEIAARDESSSARIEQLETAVQERDHTIAQLRQKLEDDNQKEVLFRIASDYRRQAEGYRTDWRRAETQPTLQQIKSNLLVTIAELREKLDKWGPRWRTFFDRSDRVTGDLVNLPLYPKQRIEAYLGAKIELLQEIAAKHDV